MSDHDTSRWLDAIVFATRFFIGITMYLFC
jgi:hypothetical protein